MFNKIKIPAVILLALVFMGASAHALTGVYVMTGKHGSGCVMKFTKDRKFTIVVYDGQTKKRNFGHGTYVISGKTLVMTTSDGMITKVEIERNGDIYDKTANLRLHRYYLYPKTGRKT